MKAIVFAAGKGERLWPLTESRPKPLLALAGRPILEGTLRKLVESGIREILLVVNYKEDMIRDSLQDGKHLGCHVSYVRQKHPSGTADALRSCEATLENESRFVVIYGDDYYSSGAVANFVKTGLRSREDMMAAVEVEDASRFGRLEIRRDLVSSILEKEGGGPGRVNAGLYMLSNSVFKALKKTRMSGRGEYELTDSLTIMIRGGRKIRAFPLKRKDWLGVTYPWDLLDANRVELEGFPFKVLGQVEDGVKVKGPVSVSKGAVVKSGSYLEGPLFVGEDSTIGPNSYLRSFTSVGSNCKVGAGCEVKNSILMDNVKVPHLSYLGDSVVGEASSLGAGTVTANLRFDNAFVQSRVKGRWVNSHRRKLGAIIGDNVRTGINVSIFPGVKLGTGAWVGPGVVVRKDIPSMGRVRR